MVVVVMVVAIAIVVVAKVVTVVPSPIRTRWTKKKRKSGCATVRVSGAGPQTTVRMRRPRRAQLRLSRAGDAVKVEEVRKVVLVGGGGGGGEREDTWMEGISYQLAGWLVSLGGAVSLSASLRLPLKVFLSYVLVVRVVVVSLGMVTFSVSLLGDLPAGAVVVVSSWS